MSHILNYLIYHKFIYIIVIFFFVFLLSDRGALTPHNSRMSSLDIFARVFVVLDQPSLLLYLYLKPYY